MVKVAHKYAEQARIAVRHVRRDGMDALKKLEKDGHHSLDDTRNQSDELQKLTDDTIKEIDAMLSTKEREITQV
jgi:ribosome recycling factor